MLQSIGSQRIGHDLVIEQQQIAMIIPILYKLKLRLREVRQIVTSYTANSEKEMAPHSSTFAWQIPWMEEPGRLQSMGSLRVGHD